MNNANVQFGDRHTLNASDRVTLEERVLPTAKRWVESFPSLRGQGINTLNYWSEPVPKYSGDGREAGR